MFDWRSEGDGQAGFSLVELIVTIFLVTVVTSIVVANYNEYERRTVLDNLAQDVALSIRLAQTFGLNVRDSGSDSFEVTYGIRFALSTPNEYILFRDSDRGGGGGFQYSGAADDVREFEITDGFGITDLCIDGVCTYTELQIMFDRPRPDAIFRTDVGPAGGTTATIELTNPSGQQRTVSVNITGFISTQ